MRILVRLGVEETKEAGVLCARDGVLSVNEEKGDEEGGEEEGCQDDLGGLVYDLLKLETQ